MPRRAILSCPKGGTLRHVEPSVIHVPGQGWWVGVECRWSIEPETHRHNFAPDAHRTGYIVTDEHFYFPTAEAAHVALDLWREQEREQ